jgi:F-type H+-transporting ATPase subunit delta
MNRSKISVRYAKALFLLGKEADQLSSLQEDITKVQLLCHQSDDLMHLFNNPVIKTSRKISIIRKVLQPHISDLALRFILLVIEHQRESELTGICRNFICLVRTEQGIIPVVVTTANQLSAEVLAAIHQNLERETGKNIELTHKINPAIIGGMIIRIEDFQYDGSISAQLNKVRAALTGKVR